MKMFWLVYGNVSDTLNKTSADFKSIGEFHKHIGKNNPNIKVVYFAPYEYLVDNVKAEILAYYDSSLEPLEIAVSRYMGK